MIAHGLAAAVVVAALSATPPRPPAVAATPEVASFRIGAAEFVWRLPGDYCLPTGRAAEAAQLIAAGDTSNVTDASVFHCTGGVPDAARYVLIKTPREALVAEVDRPTLLAGLGSAFDSPEFARSLASGAFDKTASDGLTKVFGSSVAMTSAVAPRGRDALCGYLAGTVAVTAAVGKLDVALAACITSVRHKVLTVYAYGRQGDAAGLAALTREVRAIAAELVAENEK